MKKIYLSFVLSLLAICVKATLYTVSIVGSSYSPSVLTVTVGDVVTIQASGTHPLVEVDQTTWNANGSTPKAGGFGTQSSNYTFTVTNTNTIYYVCQNHVSSGMKGQINVSAATNVKELFTNATLSLYPNPVKEKLTIKFNASNNGTLKGRLFNVCGSEIESVAINENYSAGEVNYTYVLPSKINQGIYLLELVYENKKSIHKIIVE